ncbi:hypothetical protein OXV67_10045, partial [Bacteroides fragilis]|uniref:hypothetical protein n=1 Tax=Bacteroides hominis TaxID=2763023 RepID=UPI00227B0E27
RDGKDYKTDKGRKLSFMRGIFISCWINHKKRKKLEGTLFGHPQYFQNHFFYILEKFIKKTNVLFLTFKLLLL